MQKDSQILVNFVINNFKLSVMTKTNPDGNVKKQHFFQKIWFIVLALLLLQVAIPLKDS
jgi:hypothetical protein